MYRPSLSLPLLSESVEFPESLGKERHVKTKLATMLKEEGFDFSREDNLIKYQDFFNEANLSTKHLSNGGEVAYNISITAKCMTAIILSLLLLLPVGLILTLVWYLKYSKLRRSIRSAASNLTQA